MLLTDAEGTTENVAPHNAGAVSEKPHLSFWQIWNMCFGFAGIQFGFALQNANASRIFQSLGAHPQDIPMLWIAAPIMGLLIQPVIGYMSDKTWNRFGRRRPYLLAGAVCASLALFIMPNSGELWIAAGMLWILNAALNVALGPAVALVGDMLPARQRSSGFSTQSFFIGVSAVMASALPWLLNNVFGVSNVAVAGSLPASVVYAFYIGGALLLLSMLWTSLSVREYAPPDLARLCELGNSYVGLTTTGENKPPRWGFLLATSLAGALLIIQYRLDPKLYIVAVGIGVYGVLRLAALIMRSQGYVNNALFHFSQDLAQMPRIMRQLAVVQFLSWFALFSLWIYGTSAVTSYHFGTSDTTSKTYSEGADWVGVLFAAYNGFAAVAALAIPYMARVTSYTTTHAINLLLGAVGLVSFIAIDDPAWLMLPMVLVGFSWASILSLPYTILSCSLPATKMGVYAGIFNLFIVLPQIVASSVLAVILHRFFDGNTIHIIVLSGICMALAAAATLFIDKKSLSAV